MLVWCRLCENTPVDVHPDDALHESFTERPVCGDCQWLVEIRETLDRVRELCRELAAKTMTPLLMYDPSERFRALGPYESAEYFGG